MKHIRKYETVPEEELALLAGRGDHEAFSALVDRTSVRLRNLLSGYGLGTEIDDVCQESYRKAYQAMAAYSPECSRFFTWLTTIAVHTALDYLRARSRKDVSALVDDEGMIHDSPSSGRTSAMVDSPEEMLIRHQFCERMIAHIHSLPVLYREIAEYRFLDELPYDEIASKTSLPLNTVRTRIRRAKELLVELMEE